MRFICWFILASLFTVNQCSYEERVSVLPNNIRVRYEHQIKDETYEFTQTIHTELFNDIKPKNCSANEMVYCLDWGDYGQFRIEKIDDHCDNYGYRTTYDQPLTVSFDIKNIYIYGEREISNQTWPIKVTERKMDSFVSKEDNSAAVLEPIWYTSTGFYLLVSQNVPLFIHYERDELNLIAKNQAPYIRGNITHLNYKICKYDNLKTAFKRAIADSLGKPTAAPDYKMVENPIWSTWAKYKTEINESSVLEFADLIISHDFPDGQLEIDDKWETCYGSLTVDTKRFPDMKGLVDKIHKKGFPVTIWVHPFVNVECSEYFSYGKSKNYFVKDANGSVVTSWWNGKGAYIDFTNHEAVDWYQMRLLKVRDSTGIDSFKFDAGESSWSPQLPIFHTMTDDHPETILKSYVNVAASFGNKVEVRSARQTQKYPIFVRMIDRETDWTGRLALSTIIPELLHMNVIGYPYVLPDMIGGNGYEETKVTKELFVRWLQINVFMPSMQFSYPPWEFDDEVVEITKKFVDLHKKFAPKIYDLMKQATKDEIMVNPPLWWIDPTDTVAQRINSEFLLGDDLLVAPVLKKGAKSRDIYFPKGDWRDETIMNAPVIHGPTWVYNYSAELNVLPYFTKIPSSSSILLPTLFVVSISLFVYLFNVCY